MARYRVTLPQAMAGMTEISLLGKKVKIDEWTEYTDEEIGERYAKRPDVSITMILTNRELYADCWDEEQEKWVPASHYSVPQGKLLEMAMEKAAQLAKERDERRARKQVKALETELVRAKADRDGAEERLRSSDEQLAEATTKLAAMERANT